MLLAPIARMTPRKPRAKKRSRDPAKPSARKQKATRTRVTSSKSSTHSVREAESLRRAVSKRSSPKELGRVEEPRRESDVGPDDRDGQPGRSRDRDVERERYEGSRAENRDIERDPVGPDDSRRSRAVLAVRRRHGLRLGGAPLAQEDRQHDDRNDGEELALPVLERLEPEL